MKGAITTNNGFTKREYAKILRCAMDIGERMLICGTEVAKVEDSISRICKAYGAARVDVLSITSTIITTIETPEGDCITQTRRIAQRSNDLSKVEALSRLSRKICEKRPSIGEIEDDLKNIDSMKPMPWYIAAIASLLVSAAFAVFFGGSWRDGVAASVVAAFVFVLDRYAIRLKSNVIVFNLLASLIAGVLCIGCVKFGLGENLDFIMIGVIMLLIPGMALTGAIEDLLMGDTITGLLRLCEAVIAAFAIAAGFAVSIYMFGATDLVDLSSSGSPNKIVQLIAAIIGAGGFGIKFGMKRVLRIVTAAIAGFVGWGAYLLAAHFIPHEYFLNDFFSCLIASTAGAAFSQIMARVMRAPATVFLVPAVIPLVPGRALYYTASSIVNGSLTMMSKWGTTTGLEALAIALGIVLVLAAVGVMKSIYRKIKQRKKA